MSTLCSSIVGGHDANSYRISIRPCEDLRSWLWPERLWLWDTAGSGIKVTGRRGVAGSAAPVGRVPLGNAAAVHHHHLLPLHSTHVRCPRGFVGPDSCWRLLFTTRREQSSVTSLEQTAPARPYGLHLRRRYRPYRTYKSLYCSGTVRWLFSGQMFWSSGE